MSVYQTRPWLKLYPAWVPADLPIPQLSAIDQFRATVREYAERPAVYYFDTVLTYRELDRLSNALAAGFRDLGVNKGSRVGLYLQNVPQFWIAQLAAWKLGAIVVPLNPMLKAEELRFHLQDSGTAVLVALESLYEQVAAPVVREVGLKAVITTSELDFLGGGPRPTILTGSVKARPRDTADLLDLCGRYSGAADPGVPVRPEDTAYLTYTSGTTGVPKGAMNTHLNVAFNAEVYRVWMQLGPGDVVVGAAPVFHITGMVGHLAVAALAGMPVILAYRFDAGEILRLTEKWRGTFLVAAVTAYIALMNHPDIGRRNLFSLTKAYSGGAPVPPAVVDKFRELTGIYIHHIYGLTETTSPSHAVPLGVEAPVLAESGALSVGLPVPNTLARVVSLEGEQDVGPGELGEVAIKGPMVVPGYWQKPAETARALREGWLFTGDVGLMDEAGWFYIIDRVKDMIIASGYKVWPREVEDVLYRHEAVREAAVVGVPDPYRGETVKAFVSLKPGYEGKVTPEELIEFCRARLAAYKYPRVVEIVDEVPKTPTGKFLRRLLRGGEQRL
jgi:long-chain acyl-CoA synthetase